MNIKKLPSKGPFVVRKQQKTETNDHASEDLTRIIISQ